MKCRAPEYRPNLEIVDESTARTILTNIRNAGVEALYFGRYQPGPFGRYDLGSQFLEPSFVTVPAYKCR